MKMKFILTVLVSLAASGLAAAGTNDLTTPLQRGLFEEEANHQLDAAIVNYKDAIEHFDQERQLAATAIFRLGECYRKLGRTNEAAVQYNRIIREFDDHNELVTLSRQSLTGMGMSAPAVPSSLSAAARQKQQQILQEEIKVVEQQLELQRTQVKTGTLPEEATLATVMKTLELKRQLAELEGNPALTPSSVAASESGASVLPSDEAKFLQEVKESVQNSPDLMNQQLETAALLGYVSAAEFLIAHGADVNRSAPIVEAAKKGNEAMVELLLNHGAAVDSRDNTGEAALSYAGANGFMTVCRTLVAHGADVNAKNNSGSTPLQFAVESGQLSAAEFLITNKAQIDVRASGTGMTPLTSAIRSGETEMVKLLLDHRADVNFETEPPNGPRSPLYFAIEFKQLQIAQLLLDHGVKLNAADRNGDTALLQAIGQADINRNQENMDMILLLVDHGADVNVKDKSGSTPLYIAVERGAVPAAEILIANKAQVDLKTVHGETPLMLSVMRNNTNMAKLLLDNHADANLESIHFNRNGPGVPGVPGLLPRGTYSGPISPLLWAVVNSRTEMVQLLLDHGAKPNEPDSIDSNGITPLFLAIQSDNIDAVRMLIAHGADVNFLDKRGDPPLAFLTQTEYGHQIKDLLIKAGADADYTRRRAIWTYGDDGSAKDEIFQCPTNSINHYTLLEFLATIYEANPKPGVRVDSSHLESIQGTYLNDSYLVPFPEFARVSIHRLEGKRAELLHVNVEAILHGGDGSKDVALLAGDLIEIAKQEHKVADRWYGLSAADVTALDKCLSRTVLVISRGHTNDLALVPSLADAARAQSWNALPPQAFLDFSTNRLAEALKGKRADTVVRSFHLNGVVRDANVLLNTWDLSRVQLIRGGAKMTFDLTTKSAPIVWLEDGDVIEILELGEVGPSAEVK
ncbi:MAG TPA: ankyrin repeat domain-containing protein [Verrucomicrobiae bacterium]|nr:ankyrin repeat domain-containing protein [Verrucomicrobiae bacterium]